ncbi:MAG: FMN-binding protein [Saprospiraceae bacterium]|jgi:electron transport complex protein RnfG|nr:FMN-binding protein [Saprospiraceae bacterium]
MSIKTPAELNPEASNTKMLVSMVGIGVICALLIVFTFEGTSSYIEANKAEALEKAIFKVIPGIAKTKAFQINQDLSFTPLVPDNIKKSIVYAGYDASDQLKGIAIQANGQGYGEVLNVLYGYDPATQKIIGFYVLESKETPGLGDKIEKDERFLKNFEALDCALTDDFGKIKNQIKTVKSGAKTNGWEIDGISGATISSRAVGNIISISTDQWIPLIYKNQKSFLINNKSEK